jgi:transcriptional regulator with XRE-family HTH domain
VHAWYGTSAWVDPTGTRRRLQALAAAGWSTRRLAARLGVTKSAIAQLRTTRQVRVLAATARDIAALYDDCWWRTPHGRYQARGEHYAERRAWVDCWRWDGVDIDGPAALPRPDVDEPDLVLVAVDQGHVGRRVRLTISERRAAVAELNRQRFPASVIAEIIGISSRTDVRYRALERNRSAA